MLGPLTRKLIEHCCPSLLQPTVTSLLLERCSVSLQGVGTSSEWIELIDRVQLAAIRGSRWDIAEIEKNVALANLDWRDLLMSSGFGEDLAAHKRWQKHALRSKDVS
jgi:hypothetical protein